MKPADVSWPAPADHPPVVGGYVVRGARRSEQAGSVLEATDPERGPVVVLLLSAGAGQDGAARDRFGQAVTEHAARHPDDVLDVAGLADRPPWVALSPRAGDDVLDTLVRAAVPPDANELPRSGPRFRLPWFARGWGVNWAPWLGTKAPRVWRRLWWLAGVLALMAILGLLLSMCDAPAPSGPGETGPASPGQSEQTPGPTPSPGQGNTPQQDPSPGSPGQPGEEGEGRSSNSRRA